MENATSKLTPTKSHQPPTIQTIGVSDLARGLEAFNQRLNDIPAPSEIKINQHANDSKYIPISHIQMHLDEEFYGLWNFEMEHVQVIANEIIGYGKLSVFHPIAQTWIYRSGCAAVMIQQTSKKNGGSGDITNIGDKIKNTLVKDFPHLEAEVLKSAARKLGKKFGRDLNREHEDVYEPEFIITSTLEEVLPLLDACKTKEEVKIIWDKYPEFQKINRFKIAFTERKNQL